MKSFILFVLVVHTAAVANASSHLTERERGAVFVIREEANDFALESREDVCIAFATDSGMDEAAILRALRDKGIRFHDQSWCNARPRGVMIFLDSQLEAHSSSGQYEFVSQISDSDPIRLYGDHFATLLRKSRYVVLCKEGSEPVLVTYQRLCCERKSELSGPAH